MYLNTFQAKENLDLRNYSDAIFRKENSLNTTDCTNNFGMLYKEKNITRCLNEINMIQTYVCQM